MPDPDDPVTAGSFGHVPQSYANGLQPGALAGARIGVIRDPRDRRVEASSEGFLESVPAGRCGRFIRAGRN